MRRRSEPHFQRAEPSNSSDIIEWCQFFQEFTQCSAVAAETRIGRRKKTRRGEEILLEVCGAEPEQLLNIIIDHIENQ